MPENNQLLSVESQLVGLPLAGPESFSQAQLDYLKRALGVDETVLWENASGDLATTALPMSESTYNFETIKVYFVDNNGNGGVQEIPMATSPTVFTVLVSHINTSGTTSYIKNGKFALTSSTITRVNEAQVSFSGSAASTTLNATNIKLYKVIGCNRIAGGN